LCGVESCRNSRQREQNYIYGHITEDLGKNASSIPLFLYRDEEKIVESLRLTRPETVRAITCGAKSM
jgi:hypothetical protein